MTTLTEEQALALCEKYALCTPMTDNELMEAYSVYEMAAALRRTTTDANALARAYKVLVEKDNKLRTGIAALYQVIGNLSDIAGVFDHPQTIKALDWASDPDAHDPDALLPFHIEPTDKEPGQS